MEAGAQKGVGCVMDFAWCMIIVLGFGCGFLAIGWRIADVRADAELLRRLDAESEAMAATFALQRLRDKMRSLAEAPKT